MQRDTTGVRDRIDGVALIVSGVNAVPPMNEAETRAEHIAPALKSAGWGVVEGSRIEGKGKRGKADIADYVLEYRNTKLAVVEAKDWNEPLTLGMAQAKQYDMEPT